MEAGAARFLFIMESILKTALELKVLELCDRTLEGFRVVDVDCRMGGRSLIRIFIESNRPEKLNAVSIDECATVSNLLSPILEADEEIPGPFDLEVSSPGLDKRLRLRSDFEEVKGKEIKLKLVESIPGQGANLTGRLEKVQDGTVVLAVNGAEVLVSLAKVKQANLVWQF